MTDHGRYHLARESEVVRRAREEAQRLREIDPEGTGRRSMPPRPEPDLRADLAAVRPGVYYLARWLQALAIVAGAVVALVLAIAYVTTWVDQRIAGRLVVIQHDQARLAEGQDRLDRKMDLVIEALAKRSPP